jgi:hypothetical protein
VLGRVVGSLMWEFEGSVQVPILDPSYLLSLGVWIGGTPIHTFPVSGGQVQKDQITWDLWVSGLGVHAFTPL